MALLALTLSLLTASPASADSYDRIEMCTDGGPRPCVASILRNGEVPGEGWTFYGIVDTSTPPDGVPTTSVMFDVWRETETRSSAELGAASLGDTWQVTLDMGTVVPRGVGGNARDVTVVRSKTDGTYTVQVTGHPVTRSGQCDPYTYCPEYSENPDPHGNQDWMARFGVTVHDFANFDDQQIQDAVYGTDVFSNVAVTSIPPHVRHDDETGLDYLAIEMRNRHFLEDGVTVFQGHMEVRIPNEFLRRWYGIPNPELMTTESLDPEMSGRAAGSGTISVTQDTAGDATVVLIDGVTFSHRVLRIKRGVIVPTRPGNFITHRITPSSSELFFTNAEARGAKVRGHEARCTPTRGNKPVVTELGGSAPIIIDGLAPGTKYDCHVRGLSKAGPGPWSKMMRT